MNAGFVATTLTALVLFSLGTLEEENRGDGPGEWTRSFSDGASLFEARRPPWATRFPGCVMLSDGARNGETCTARIAGCDAAARADGPATVVWISNLFSVVCVEWGSDPQGG